ncbi:hypothetical protein [Azorhizobium sp. AG788]|uniref:hypothetical protein n=1 Tax=Azorhizobium sp. AG788 TaxID=2183897 RepID=UPI0031393F6B
MTRLLSLFRGLAALVVAAVVAVLVFTVLGSLLMAAGIFIAVVVVAGGLYLLLFGRGSVTMQRSSGRNVVIDVTAVDVTPRRDRPER